MARVGPQRHRNKYKIICYGSQEALRALQAAKMFLVIQQCQMALNDTSTPHVVGMCRVSGHAGVRRNEIADKLARDGSVQKFVGPEPSLRVSKQNIKKEDKTVPDSVQRWLYKVQVC
jgi:hypothetical protein